MKLTFKGEELDASKEHEIFSTNEYGFKATIQFKKESWYPEKTQTLNNLTEVHWRYTDLFNPTPCNRVALESDIHRTGGTREIADIESLTIEDAQQLEQDW